MRLLLVGNYPLDNQASMSRYTEMLRRNMTARGHLVDVVRPKPVLGPLVTHRGLRKWLGYVDKYLLFPVWLRSHVQGYDLVHVCDHSNSMYLAHTSGVPSSITCHDVLAIAAARGRYPQQKVAATGKVQQRWILEHLAEADNVVCVSWNTARELATLTRRPAHSYMVIPNAVERPPDVVDVTVARQSVGLAPGERYLLHVGGDTWYKNRLGALRIYKLLRERLGERAEGLKVVMAGAPLTEAMREFARTNLPEANVLELQRPPDNLLWALYGSAEALLFPSLHEGFGWPILEAQSCGCPVITSNRVPMTEVAGPAAVYVDPSDEAGAAEIIASRWSDLPGLRDAGFNNLKRFEPGTVYARFENFFAGVLRTRRSTDVVIAPNEAEIAARRSREG
jgi:glycosyltransferase involved in cell wall biosynthesis